MHCIWRAGVSFSIDLAWFWYGSGMVLVLCCYDVGIVLVLCWWGFGTFWGMLLVCFCFVFGMFFWFAISMALLWFCIDWYIFFDPLKKR